MTHAARIALFATALAFAAPGVAAAQEEPPATQTDASAEQAFLRAYYLEIGQHQHVRALDEYRRLLKQYPDSAAVPRTWIAVARVSQALGRHDDALAALDHVTRAFPADTEAVAAAAALRKTLEKPAEDDLSALVGAALQEDAWDTRVPAFGNRAVPVLAKLLRAADPTLVYRAGRSLFRIASDDACDALLESLTATDILYPDRIVNGALARGPYPERLGQAVLRLEDTELRDTLVAHAMHDQIAGLRKWLRDAVFNEEWAWKIAFPPETVERAGTACMIVQAVAAGPGPARDAALAHLRLYEPRQKGRGRARGVNLESAAFLFGPEPAEFLADREALRTAAKHVYSEDGSNDPSVELRDALLADPETRELALHWSWRYSMPCGDRELLIDALSASTTPLPVSDFLPVFRASLAPGPSGAEWRRILGRDDFDRAFVDQLLGYGAEDDRLPASTLDAFLEAGHAETVLRWLVQRPLPADAWAADALPPLLKSDRSDIAIAAAEVLAKYHWAERLDISRHLPERFVALSRHDRFWSANMVLAVIVHRMGDAGPAALVAATPLGTRGDEIILDRLLGAERPEASAVAERLLLAPIEDDDHQALKRLEKAVYVLAAQRGDDAVPTLLRAVRLGPVPRRTIVARETWKRPEISPAGAEAFTGALIEDLPEGLRFQPHAGSLDTDALRRLSLRALASEHETLQSWGAGHQTNLLDASAAVRLGEFAESSSPRVREMARSALAAMRKADQDMEWMRAVAARRATRGRVDGYLASADAKERMAGVAGLVALRAPDALERLLEVAAKDVDADVRAEARRALLALGDRQGDGPLDDE